MKNELHIDKCRITNVYNAQPTSSSENKSANGSFYENELDACSPAEILPRLSIRNTYLHVGVAVSVSRGSPVLDVTFGKRTRRARKSVGVAAVYEVIRTLILQALDITRV